MNNPYLENLYSSGRTLSPLSVGILNAHISTKLSKDDIKDVIFNDPATIVFWRDGTKTVVKCQEGDKYSKELGLAMAIVKKMAGNKGNYNDIFHKWVYKEDKQ